LETVDLLTRLRSALAERYAVERELGHGGMATVFLAEDRKHTRRVAIKVIPADDATGESTDRFLREIRITAGLQHPHILPLHDSGACDGLLYYVMPHVQGDSLRDRLDHESRLPIEVALRIAQQVADALQYAHAQGIIHRDVKPGNILLSGGHALLADFGISSALQEASGLIATGSPIGTLDYMSPEQMADGSVDGRTDQYALAAMTFEMLTGWLPFEDSAGMRERPRSLSGLRPEVGVHVERALARALARAPEDRFATIAEFTSALTRGPGSPDASGIPSNLPAGLSSFVGRAGELAECRDLLKRSRLLSLVGVGGSGKTRLAIHLGQEIRREFPGGVWFVDLAPIMDGDRVAPAVAGVLEVRPEPGQTHLQAIAARLGSQRTLLLLDNGENVLSACAELAESLLRACGELQIVVTSRESLGCTGEQTYVVPPLSMPTDSSGIGPSDSVRLFVERAASVRPGFQLTDQNAPTIAEICRRLDGGPLAIELAAANVRMLSVEEIRDRLADRFRLLVDRGQGPARHRALLAILQWSYDHLEEEERRLLRFLSVLAGSWKLAAARALVQEVEDEYRVLDQLTRLVNKSLVLVDPHETAESRLRLLETVRQFADGRLEESGEKETARARHAEFFAREAAEVEPQLRGEQQASALARLRLEHEDLLAALAWYEAAPGGGPRALALAAAIWRFWYADGHARLGMHVIERLLARSDIEASADRIEVRLGAGLLALDQGLYPESRHYYDEALADARQTGSRYGIARALNGLGAVVGHGEDRFEEALGFFQQSLDLHREMGDKRAEGIALSNLSEALMRLDRLEEAHALMEQSLDCRRAAGDKHGTGLTQLNAARLALRMGHLSEAYGRIAEALDLVSELQQRPLGANALDACALLMEQSGDHFRSARMAGAADELREKGGFRRAAIERSEFEALRARLIENLGTRGFTAAFESGRIFTFEQALFWVRSRIGSHRETRKLP
jgi:non-specific serine/threonine protein kinase